MNKKNVSKAVIVCGLALGAGSLVSQADSHNLVAHAEEASTLVSPTVVVDNSNETYHNVTVTLVNLNSEGTLKYSLDNGVNWLDYTTPFEVDKNVVITTKVVNGETESPSYTHTVSNIVPIKAPTFSAQTLEDNTTNLTILNANTEGSIMYKKDDGAWENYTAPINLAKATVVKTKIVVGTKESAESTYTYTVEAPLSQPEINTTELKTGQIKVNLVNTSAKGTIYYKLDNGTWTKYTSSLTLSETKVVSAKVVDGTRESNVTTETVKVEGFLNKPIASSNQKDNGTVDINLVNPNNKGQIYYKLNDSEEWEYYLKAINVKETTKVTSVVRYSGFESEPTEYTLTYSNALKSPTYTADKKSDGSVDVTLSNPNSSGDLYYKIGDGEYTKYSSTFNVPSSAIVKLKVVDGESESVESTLNVVVSTNLTSPSISANTGEDGNVTITIDNPNNSGKIMYKSSSGIWTEYKDKVVYTQSAKVVAKIVDGDKQSPESVYDIVINKSLKAPTLAVKKNVDGTMDITVNNPNVYISKQKLYYQLDDGEWLEYKSPVHLTKSSKFSAKIIEDGKESNITQANYTLENQEQICNCLPPKITIGTEEKTDALNVFLYKQDSYNADMYYKIGEDGEWTKYNLVLGILLRENTTIYSKVVDANGLSSELTSLKVTNIISNTNGQATELEKPTITKSKPYNHTVTVSINSKVNGGVIEYRLGNGEWKIYTKAFTLAENTVVQSRVSKDNIHSDVSMLTVDDFIPVNTTPPENTDNNTDTDKGEGVYVPEVSIPSKPSEVDSNRVITDETVLEELFSVKSTINAEKTASTIKIEPLYDTDVHAVIWAKGERLSAEEVLKSGNYVLGDNFTVKENGEYTFIIINSDGTTYLTYGSVQGIVSETANNSDVPLGIETPSNPNTPSSDTDSSSSSDNSSDNSSDAGSSSDNNSGTNSNVGSDDTEVSEEISKDNLPQTGYNNEDKWALSGLLMLTLSILTFGVYKRKKKLN